MTTQWYYRRIHRLFYLLSSSSKEVLPANRYTASWFMGSSPLECIQNLLSGLQGVSDWDDTDWADDHVFHKFKPWILANEGKMDQVLRALVYYIDQDNTLNTVTGSGRPERVRVASLARSSLKLICSI
jgi:hypothetical protein